MLKISCRMSRHFLTKLSFLHQSFPRTQVPKLSCHIISIYRTRFLKNNYFILFYRECKQEKKIDHAFWIRKTFKTKRKEERNNSAKKEGKKTIYDQTVSTDLEEKCFCCGTTNRILMSIIYLKYENDK